MSEGRDNSSRALSRTDAALETQRVKDRAIAPRFLEPVVILGDPGTFRIDLAAKFS